METLAVDISLDLPQILGRQRLTENPWKNEAEFYYKPLATKKRVEKEDFDKIIKAKETATQNSIDIFENTKRDTSHALNDLIKRFATLIEVNNYSEDYLSLKSIQEEIVDTTTGEVKVINNIVPVFNNLVRVSELRAFEIQQVDYKDRFHIFSNLDSSLGLGGENQEVREFLAEYQSLPKLYDKLKYLCDLDFQGRLSSAIMAQVSEKHFQEYFTVLGSERIKALAYNTSLLNKELGILTFDNTTLLERVYSIFIPGNRYSLVNIKQMLLDIYQDVGYKKTPVATDLQEWFSIKSVQINTKISKGVYKRDQGFEILSKK
jgi:hypothetical protein